MKLEYEEFKNYIKELGFDLNVDEYPKVKETLQYYAEKQDIKGLEHYMKQLQNCGGYALQIPACVFSGSEYTFEEQVLRIQELYPFTRLLSDTQLKENEYLVKYRSGKTGHHFIRVDENGNVTEKHEINLPSTFKGWGTLENDSEAVFAVVKQEYREDKIKKLPQCNRDMFLDEEAYYFVDENGYVDIRKNKATKPKTFRDRLQEAYNSRKSNFLYQNKDFYLKKDKHDSELIYICNDTEILAELCTDGEEFIIEYNNDESKNKIFGFKPNNNIEIKKTKEDNSIEL